MTERDTAGRFTAVATQPAPRTRAEELFETLQLEAEKLQAAQAAKNAAQDALWAAEDAYGTASRAYRIALDNLDGELQYPTCKDGKDSWLYQGRAS